MNSILLELRWSYLTVSLVFGKDGKTNCDILGRSGSVVKRNVANFKSLATIDFIPRSTRLRKISPRHDRFNIRKSFQSMCKTTAETSCNLV